LGMLYRSGPLYRVSIAIRWGRLGDTGRVAATQDIRLDHSG